MECLKASLAILLCWSLAFPAPLGFAQEATASASTPDAQSIPNPPRRQAYQSALIQGDDRILHALNRFTFGAKPGDLEAVRKLGLENWFEQQLHPGALDEKDLNAKLGNYPAMQWTPEDLMYRAPNPGIIRQAVNGKQEIPTDGTLHAVYENQIYRLQLKKEGLLGKKAQAANAAQSAQPQAAASDSLNSAPSAKSANQNDAMAASPDMSMAAPQTAAANQNSTASQNSAEVGASNAAQQAAAPQVVEPLVSNAEIREILALPPDQRVDRLSAMQPDVFESFIKSLKGPQRQLLMADLDPSLRECVEDLENPRQMVVEELFAQRLTRDIYSNAQLAGSDDRLLAQSLQRLPAQERADAVLPRQLRARRDSPARAGQI